MEETRQEREGLFVRWVRGYMRGDLGIFAETMRPEAVMVLGGGSALSGTYAGHSAIRDFLGSLAGSVRSSGLPITYFHDEDSMIARQRVVVGGIDCRLAVTTLFDAEGLVTRVLIEPEDLEMFDRAVAASLRRAEESTPG